MAPASSRERARTVVLVLLGLLFFAAAIVPVVQSLVRPPRCTAGPMLNLAQRGELLASVALVGLGGILLKVFAPPRSDQSSVAVPLRNV